MIVVEGPDGSGKSTLVRKLCEDLGLPLHERACTSEGGPVADLAGWATRDVSTWRDQAVAVYDRHPFISEYVYGPAVRGRMDPGFATRGGQATVLRERMKRQALVVWCDPGVDSVREAARSGGVQMPGVAENVELLHALYVAAAVCWSGWSVGYDWRRPFDAPTGYGSVLQMARLHAAEARVSAL